MLAAALVLVVIGIATLFVIPWVGVPAGAIGLILLLIYAVAAVRRPARRESG